MRTPDSVATAAIADAGAGPAAKGPRARGPLTLLKRVGAGLLTVWAASVVVFLAVEVLPQDPARTALGLESTEAQRQAFRQEHGLDDPAPQRYGRWAAGMLRGDFGTSIISGRPIAEELGPRLGYTAILAFASIVISLVVGIPLALRAARRPGGVVDSVANLASVSISAVPEFVIGLLLAYLLASQLRLLPVLSGGIADGQWAALVLPALTLGLTAVSYVFRFGRVGVIEATEAAFVRSAILRGLPQWRVTWHHVLPVAATVVVNVVALNAIYLVGGVIVVENLFAYPGVGNLLLTGVTGNDLPVIEAVAVVTAALLVAINLVADAVVVLLNPRLRAGWPS